MEQHIPEEVIEEIAELLESGVTEETALFFPHELPDESQEGYAIWVDGDLLKIGLFNYFYEDGVWVLNSPGLAEIAIELDDADAFHEAAEELLGQEPDLDMEGAEEIDTACILGTDIEDECMEHGEAAGPYLM